MADYVAASLTLPTWACAIPTIAQALTNESPDFIEAHPDSTTTISADSVAYGIFTHLEEACRTADIAYDRKNGGDYTIEPLIAYFRPNQPFVELLTNRDGEPLTSVSFVRQLLTTSPGLTPADLDSALQIPHDTIAAWAQAPMHPL
jgi:hypothetical protein